MAQVGLILIIGVTAVFADLCPEPVWTNFFDNFSPLWTDFVITFVLKTMSHCMLWTRWIMVLIPGDSKWRDLWQKVWQLFQWPGEWIFIYISTHQVHYDQGFWLITTTTTIINTITITHQTIVQVRCDRGFQLIGNSRLKCRNGVWSGPTPVCTVLGDFLWYNTQSTVLGDFHFIIKSQLRAPSTISVKRRLPGHRDPDQRTRDSRPRIKDVRVQVF